MYFIIHLAFNDAIICKYELLIYAESARSWLLNDFCKRQSMYNYNDYVVIRSNFQCGFETDADLITTDSYIKCHPTINVNYETFARLTVDFHGAAVTSVSNIVTGCVNSRRRLTS